MGKLGLMAGTVCLLLLVVPGVSKGGYHHHHRTPRGDYDTRHHSETDATSCADSQEGQQDASFRAADPGVRDDDTEVGGMLPGLTPDQQKLFREGRTRFMVVQGVRDGLGPRFNLNGCSACHIQPAVGGSSPQENPQYQFVRNDGGDNVLPDFIERYGPIREAHLKYLPNGDRDGHVYNVFVISGLPGVGRRCRIEQPDFAYQADNDNLIFRIPTPLFGDGLIEAIPDNAILEDQMADGEWKEALGIHGRPNRIRVPRGTTNIGGDNTIARFGWKAQNKSLLAFAGEAYNIEMGISNELFQTERDETPACQLAATPNDVTHPSLRHLAILNDITVFAAYMRFLAPPPPSPDTPGGESSIDNGRELFSRIGCALCHTPTLRTGEDATVQALRNQPVNLYSDLLLHHMGPALADDIVQGLAGPDEFRTAPLWGLGQRIFFLHDGRTSDLLEAIAAHQSGSASDASEANAVIRAFNRLDERQKQDLLNFLRSL